MPKKNGKKKGAASTADAFNAAMAAAAANPSEGFTNHPPGRFHLQLQQALLGGDLWMGLDWIVLQGEEEGGKFRTFQNLKKKDGTPNDVGMRILCGDLIKMGFDEADLPQSKDDLDECAEKLTAMAPCVDATLKYKNDFAQFTIHELLEGGDDAPEDAPGDVDDAPDVEELEAFCKERQIKLSRKQKGDVDALMTEICSFEWTKEDELTDEEHDLLERIPQEYGLDLKE